ncbi:hypothetical protein [Amycolatopsis sp. NPDC021455]|uniref:hypothetical protein n=1 Tax=Amycolatopsis sp. NPDC021455 TaxID=3154901 RepID=UPI0033EF4BE9
MDAVPVDDEAFYPTADSIRAWAYSGADQPSQDWDLLVAELEHLPLLLELVGDPGCPARARETLLGSLYCMVGHTPDKKQFLDAARVARQSADAWLVTWARRVREIIDHPQAFDRADWCGFPGYAARPAG